MYDEHQLRVSIYVKASEERLSIRSKTNLRLVNKIFAWEQTILMFVYRYISASVGLCTYCYE